MVVNRRGYSIIFPYMIFIKKQNIEYAFKNLILNQIQFQFLQYA